MLLRAGALLPLLTASTCVFSGSPPETSGGVEPAPADAPPCFDRIATALADDAMEGRGLGTDGLARAADLIATELAAAGLEVSAQEFDVQVGVARDATEERLAFGRGGDDATADAWTPLPFSSPGSVDGAPIAFVGYGITAPALGYDDYAGVDATGAVAVMLRYEPGEDDEDSPFDGRRATRWSDLRYKVHTARQAGAAAVVFVDGGAGEDERLPRLEGRGPTSPAGIPVVQVKLAEARSLVPGIDDLRAEIDATYEPRSRMLEGTTVTLEVALEIETSRIRNVVGVLPGAGARAEETVVVGAHYDHLGYGGHGSMAPESNAVHNGADDNASGVAAMICGVRELTRGTAVGAASGDRRALVAIAFAGEEHGLLGSAEYVNDPVRDLATTAAMVNLDMVGRLEGGPLSALGSDTAPQWRDLLTAAGAGAGVEVALGGDGYGPSDHMSFYLHGVPVVHLFTGAHSDYHAPSDDADKLDMAGGAAVTSLLAGLTTDLLGGAELTYVKSEAAPTMGADSRSSGAWLGTIPDYTAMEAETGGVLLGGVREGGPAHTAGVRGGDVIVGFSGMEIANLYDLTFALRDHEPGDIVEIVVLRDGVERRFAATLGDRSKRGGGGGPDPHGGGGGPDPHGGGATPAWTPTAGKDASHLLHESEVHLADLRQLTFGGENAEAYFSPDGKRLIFQRTPPEGGCDQQFELDLTTGEQRMVSSGRGRTTCGYYTYPHGDSMIFATTEFADADCPPVPDRSQGYVWPLYAGYEIVGVDVPGDKPFKLIDAPGYDAEATVCFTDGRIVFTSVRSGDLELWVSDADGGNLKQLTDTPGYDGGAFFTPDCSEIVWRASRPEGDALADYERLLAQGLVRPGSLEIFLMDADGTNVRRLTDNGAANFGPYPTPDSSGIVFSSNVGNSPREFDLWRVGREGGELERITFAEGFDGFPMFSPDGQWFVFGSNRGGDGRETNVFIARWVE